MRESSVVLFGSELIDYGVGTAGSVEFNFDRIWEHWRGCGSLASADKLHFMHVHPLNFLGFSELDIDCMKGLKIAFGEYPLFTVVVFNSIDMYDLEYHSISTMNLNDAATRRNMFIDRKCLALLKIMSYGMFSSQFGVSTKDIQIAMRFADGLDI